MKKIFALVSVAIAALIMGACEGLGPVGQAEVWIEYAYERSYSELYYVTYVHSGDDGHSGKNIFAKRKGEGTFKGKQYDIFPVPRGLWDIYFEWYQESWPGGFRNQRSSVNFKTYDWMRFDWMGPDYNSAYYPHVGNWPMDE